MWVFESSPEIRMSTLMDWNLSALWKKKKCSKLNKSLNFIKVYSRCTPTVCRGLWCHFCVVILAFRLVSQWASPVYSLLLSGERSQFRSGEFWSRSPPIFHQYECMIAYVLDNANCKSYFCEQFQVLILKVYKQLNSIFIDICTVVLFVPMY